MMEDQIQHLFSVSEVDIVYRSKVPRENRPVIKTSENAFDIFYQSWDMNKIDLMEQFKVMLLDASASCIALSHIATGGITGCVVDPRLVFAFAVKCRATSMILAHNHPSGNLKPSNSDLAITQRLVDAGKVLDIQIFDHLIIGNHQYLSMADEGYLPSPRL